MRILTQHAAEQIFTGPILEVALAALHRLVLSVRHAVGVFYLVAVSVSRAVRVDRVRLCAEISQATVNV